MDVVKKLPPARSCVDRCCPLAQTLRSRTRLGAGTSSAPDGSAAMFGRCARPSGVRTGLVKPQRPSATTLSSTRSRPVKALVCIAVSPPGIGSFRVTPEERRCVAAGGSHGSSTPQCVCRRPPPCICRRESSMRAEGLVQQTGLDDMPRACPSRYRLEDRSPAYWAGSGPTRPTAAAGGRDAAQTRMQQIRSWTRHRPGMTCWWRRVASRNEELAERVRLTPVLLASGAVARGVRRDPGVPGRHLIRMRWGATISTGRMRDGPTIGRRSGSGYRVRPATRLMAPARMTAPNR
jgi:hypothetical protein